MDYWPRRYWTRRYWHRKYWVSFFDVAGVFIDAVRGVTRRTAEVLAGAFGLAKPSTTRSSDEDAIIRPRSETTRR